MITLTALRAAGLTDSQIVKVLEEADTERRAKDRDRQRKHRASHVSHVSHVNNVTAENPNNINDRVTPVTVTGDSILTSSTKTPVTVVQEERSEIVAQAASPVPKYPAAFEEFYQQYPRKAGKGDALKAWQKATKSGRPNAELIAGAMRYAADPNRDPQYTKHAATWLNAVCEHDEPLPQRGGQGNGQGQLAPKDDPRSIRGAFDRLAERFGPGWEDEARELSRQANFRVIPGRSSG